MTNDDESVDKCRYCIKTTDLQHLDSERINESGYDTPRELIVAVTRTPVSSVDGPQKICNDCYTRISETMMVIRDINIAEVRNQY